MADIDYLISLDNTLFTTYNAAVNAYVVYHLNLDATKSGKTSSEIKRNTSASNTVMKKGITTIGNAYKTYVTRVFLATKGRIYVYRTKSAADKKRLQVYENIVITKFYKLKTSGAITDAEFKNSVAAYNAYILNYTIGTIYKNNPYAGKRAAAYMKIFTATYNKALKKK